MKVNTVQRLQKVLEFGGGTDDGVSINTHPLVGSGGMFPQKN